MTDLQRQYTGQSVFVYGPNSWAHSVLSFKRDSDTLLVHSFSSQGAEPLLFFASPVEEKIWSKLTQTFNLTVVVFRGPKLAANPDCFGCQQLAWFPVGHDAECFVLDTMLPDETGYAEFNDQTGYSYLIRNIGSAELEVSRPVMQRPEDRIYTVSSLGNGTFSVLAQEPAELFMSFYGPLPFFPDHQFIIHGGQRPIALSNRRHQEQLRAGCPMGIIQSCGALFDSRVGYLSPGVELACTSFFTGFSDNGVLPGIKAANLFGFLLPRETRSDCTVVLRSAENGSWYNFCGLGTNELQIAEVSENYLHVINTKCG